MMELNEKEKNALKQIRPLIADVVNPDNLQSDAYLLRWLRARNFDISKTENMIKDSMKWRKENDVDNILNWYRQPEVLEKYHPVRMIGCDKVGSPIWINKVGRSDIKGYIKCMSVKEFRKKLIYNAEDCEAKMREQTKLLGRLIESQYVIMDVEGISLSHIAFRDGIEVMRQMCLMYDLNYPETIKRIIIVNAASMFPLAFSLVRPFIAEETANKIQIYGKAGWRDILTKDIDPEVLPEYYGGTRTDGSGDPRCPNLVPLGGDIPKEYYQQSVGKKLSEIEGINTIVVENRKTKSIEIRVTEEKSRISWIFGTQEHDIAFGLYRNTEKGLREYIPKERVRCHVIPEDGEFECNETGTYILVFDNMHSFFRTKKVSYKIEVLPPQNESNKEKN